MTRKLYLVNMSDCENEEYDVVLNGQGVVNLAPGEKIEIEDEVSGSERIIIEAHRTNNPNSPIGYNPPITPDGMEDYKELPTFISAHAEPDGFRVELSNGEKYSWKFSGLEVE